MQQETFFSSHLRKYLTMLMKIWPSLRVGVRHIADITGPSQYSLLPQRNYKSMSEQQFVKTLTNDLHQFIMEHDVREEDIEDYFMDILDLLNIFQDPNSTNNQIGSVRYQSRQVIKVINELQDGKTKMIEDFQNNIYNMVMQMGMGDPLQQAAEESSSEEKEEQEMQEQRGGYQSEDAQYDQEEQMDEQEDQEDNKQKTEQQLKKEQQLQDDGWVIVRKK